MTIFQDVSPEERLNDLVLRYEKDLLRMCCVYLRDITLAEDAVQEAFLKAYRHMDAFRGDSSEKTWLIRIAMNTCRDMRRNAWYKFVDRRATLDHLPEPDAICREESIALTTEIMRLPRKEMEVILLYYYQQFKMRDIAHILGISPSAVSQRLKKAENRLRTFMKGEEAYAAE